MTPTTIYAQQIDAWERIPSGKLPCAACGVAVAVSAFSEPVDNSDAPEVELLQVFGRVPSSGGAGPQLDLHLTRCATCSLVRRSAADLLKAHANERQRIGSPEIARHRLECALNALDALGTTDPVLIDRLTHTALDVRRLIEKLAAVGGTVRWATHARSAGYPRAATTPTSLTRWAHVSDEQRQELRTTTAQLLARRVERPVRVLCPSDSGAPSGCMLCGIGALEVLPGDADGVWTLMSADAVTIGGQPQPDTLDGVVCPTCDHAIDAAHGVGQSAMVLSVRAYLGVPAHVRSLEHIDGLIGWSALREAEPNAKPWDHINLSELRDSVNALLGYRTETA